MLSATYLLKFEFVSLFIHNYNYQNVYTIIITNEINLSFALHDNSSNDDVLNNGWCFGLINKRVSWHETTRCYGFEYGASSASPRMFYQAIDGFPDGVWR